MGSALIAAVVGTAVAAVVTAPPRLEATGEFAVKFGVVALFLLAFLCRKALRLPPPTCLLCPAPLFLSWVRDPS